MFPQYGIFFPLCLFKFRVRGHKGVYFFLSEFMIFHKLVGNYHKAVFVLKAWRELHVSFLEVKVQVFQVKARYSA